jgi:parallel beta-helix repeat protein
MKMSNKNSVFLLAAIAFIFILMAANSTGNIKSDISISNNLKYTAVAGSHAPISIDGNEALATFIEDEGLSGEGTSASPYIIENLIIDASTAHGIEIRSTDAYLIIRNCTVEGGKTYRKNGIYLSHAANVNISNNLLSNNWDGSGLWDSRNNTLSGNNATNNECGIGLGASSNKTLSGNNATNNGCGIFLGGSSNNTLSGNTASYNSGDGINLWDSRNNTLSGNIASYNGESGISLSFSSNNTLSENTASYNSGDGINLWVSSNNIFSGNTASYNHNYGICLWDSSNNTIYFNDIYGNTNGQAFDAFKAFEAGDCTENQWDNGTTGNYWGEGYINNYPNATNDGTIWNIPYEINGWGCGIDRFPLVNSITTTTATTTTTTIPRWTFPVLVLTIIALLHFRRLKRRSE